MENIIIFGLKNSGKTTLGKKLSLKHKKDFIDTDILIENLFFKKRGKRLSFKEIYKTCGKKYFRQLENKVISSLLKNPPKNSVISLGGSTLIKKENRKILKIGTSLYLKISQDAFIKKALENPPAFIDKNQTQKEIIFSLKTIFKKKIKILNKLNATTMQENNYGI